MAFGCVVKIVQVSRWCRFPYAYTIKWHILRQAGRRRLACREYRQSTHKREPPAAIFKKPRV